DPAADCGTWQASLDAFPGAEGSLYRVRDASRGGGGERRLEHVARDGRLASSAALTGKGRAFGLARGEILVLEEAEAILLDDGGRELTRSPLATAGGLTKGAALRLAAARRPFAPGGRPSGA